MPIASTYAHFKCNDNAANTTITDNGSGANNGTASVNTSNWSAAGKINQCFDLDAGASEYGNLDALSADIETDTTGTFCFWVNPDADSSNGAILTFQDTSGGNDYFWIRQRSTAVLELQIVGGGSTVLQAFSNSTVSNGTWVHFALVQNGTSLAMYWDGEVETINWIDQTDKGGWFDDISAANVDNGRLSSIDYNGAGRIQYFDGQLDDIRYYQNTALSQSDVQAIYNSGNGTEDDPPTPGGPSGYSYYQIIY